MDNMRLTRISDNTILCESRAMSSSHLGVWVDEGILTGDVRSTYLAYGSVFVTTHQKPVFDKLVREIENA